MKATEKNFFNRMKAIDPTAPPNPTMLVVNEWASDGRIFHPNCSVALEE